MPGLVPTTSPTAVPDVSSIGHQPMTPLGGAAQAAGWASVVASAAASPARALRRVALASEGGGARPRPPQAPAAAANAATPSSAHPESSENTPGFPLTQRPTKFSASIRPGRMIGVVVFLYPKFDGGGGTR